MVGEGGAAGDGRGNAVPQKTIVVYYILRITVYPCLIFLGRSKPLPYKGSRKVLRNLQYLTAGAISLHRYGKVSFATIVATSFMRSITSFAARLHRFPTANENDICAYGAK